MHAYIPVRVRARGVINQRKLQQGSKHEGEANTSPHVDALGVGHRRQRGIDARRLRGHREERQDTCERETRIRTCACQIGRRS